MKRNVMPTPLVLLEDCGMNVATGANSVAMSRTSILHLLQTGLLILLMSISQQAMSAAWILERADTFETVSDQMLSDLEEKAKAGDWQLMTEFAAAFFYGDGRLGCAQLKYGYRCRAMLSRRETGAILMRRVLDTTPTNEFQKSDIRSIQDDYARSQYRAAAPDYSPESDACKEAVHYAKLAIANGENCAATMLSMMTRLGRCLPADDEQSRRYHALTNSCPRY